MNAHVDTLLTKVIEDLSPLTENIERLHMMGYINNFELVGDQLMCIESRLGVSMTDVVVDEVCEYRDQDGVLSKISLFALHELKYRRKGLLAASEGITRLSI